jgi:hypothetical protein
MKQRCKRRQQLTRGDLLNDTRICEPNATIMVDGSAFDTLLKITAPEILILFISFLKLVRTELNFLLTSFPFAAVYCCRYWQNESAKASF